MWLTFSSSKIFNIFTFLISGWFAYFVFLRKCLYVSPSYTDEEYKTKVDLF